VETSLIEVDAVGETLENSGAALSNVTEVLVIVVAVFPAESVTSKANVVNCTAN